MADWLDEIEARAEAAAPGPWKVIRKKNYYVIRAHTGVYERGVCTGLHKDGRDAEFVSYSREDVLRLIDAQKEAPHE